MLKKLLLSAATGFGIWFSFMGIVFVLDGMGIEFDKEVSPGITNGGIMAVFVLIAALVSSVLVFKKVETKNTMLEDLAVNKLKIMKAEQEDKLKSFNKK